MKECFNEARPPLGKKGGGPNGAHSRKITLTPTLSLPLHPGLGGRREEKEERERERTTEKKKTHTHTHTLAHTSVPVKPEWRGKKEAGR